MAKPKKNGLISHETAQKGDETTRICAHIHGVSERYVRMVRQGTRTNEHILATVLDYKRGKSMLIKHLETLVPLTPKTKK